MKFLTLVRFASCAIILFTAGCGKSSKKSEETASLTGKLIRITHEQFKSDNMAVGAISMQTFADDIRCNGYITSSVNGIAQVSTPVAGIVESVNCSMGNYVSKGQVLCMISGNELINMQQEFTETSAKLSRLKSDYERSKSLYDEKIGAAKDFIATESEYKAMKAKYLSLKLRLDLLRLDIPKIEAGQLYASFPIRSPLSGYITKQNLVLGQFIEQQKQLVEIIDVSQLQLQLSVFEKDIPQLVTGQTVYFSPPGEDTYNNEATLVSIGKAMNTETRTITCMAAIRSKQTGNLVNQSYVDAIISVKSSEAKALPSEAIFKSGKEHFVFLVEKSDNEAYYFRKQKVSIGRTSKEFTEITDDIGLLKVLVKGGYNLSNE